MMIVNNLQESLSSEAEADYDDNDHVDDVKDNFDDDDDKFCYNDDDCEHSIGVLIL